VKVLVVLGTRPEAIKLAPVVQALRHSQVEVYVGVTAQHRELLDQVLGVLSIQPDFDLNVMQACQSPLGVAARVFERLAPVVRELKPDWLLVQGDTSTTVAAAWVGFQERVRIGHVEAGLRTGDKFSPFPEEINRRMTTVLADLHFAPTRRAVESLLREGIRDDTIFLTGNTVVDALLAILNHPVTFTDPRLSQLDQPFVLVTAHRRESFGAPLGEICKAVVDLAQLNPHLAFIFPVHPNPEVRRTAVQLLANQPQVILLDPLPYGEFVHLMKRAKLVLSDSGGVQEEAPSLGTPVLVTREITERPEAVESGWAELVGTSRQAIVTRAGYWLHRRENGFAPGPNPFGDGFASRRIARLLLECDSPSRPAPSLKYCGDRQLRP